MKHYFEKNITAFIIVITFAISSCGVSTQSASTQTVIQPTAETTQIPIKTITPQLVSTPTQIPVIVSDWQQVWSDEFNGTEIDRSYWDLDIGPFNDTVHYFTDRLDNARVVDGKLQIIALEESYNGFNYTAALLKTRESVSWRYGRIEARIKLPASNGFVPAFWMMPADDLYGWWANSGEIDIMEHPTNQVDKIFGTVHTEAYNAFTGSSPRGGTVRIPDAESEFHIYAIEWTEDKIDFFVDDQKYFTFQNEKSGHETWPFDQPFYVILNMAVGGGWVGTPNATSVFPAIMEVDYVRVYQDIHDASIVGPNFLTANSKAISYSAPTVEGLIYTWNVPEGAQITSGQGTPGIEIDWGSLSGNIELELGRDNGAIHLNYPVDVSTNILKNGGFENGSNYWRKSGVFPNADFGLTIDEVYTGSNAVYVNIKKPVAYAWDVQLSQGNLSLESGEQYHVSLWAKADGNNSKISLAVINPNDFTLYSNQTMELSNVWAQYEMNFTVPSNVTASFNIDMGEATGWLYFDNIEITIP